MVATLSDIKSGFSRKFSFEIHRLEMNKWTNLKMNNDREWIEKIVTWCSEKSFKRAVFNEMNPVRLDWNSTTCHQYRLCLQGTLNAEAPSMGSHVSNSSEQRLLLSLIASICAHSFKDLRLQQENNQTPKDYLISFKHSAITHL